MDNKEITELKDTIIEKLPQNSPFKTWVEDIYGIFLVFTLIISILNKIQLDKVSKINVIASFNRNNLKKQKEIQYILNDILILTDADRVVLGYFHNGKKAGRIDFLKISVPKFFEVTNNRTKPISKKLKNIDIDLIGEDLAIAKPGQLVFVEKSKIEDVDCKGYLESIGIEKKVTYMLPSKKALLEIHFMSEGEINLNTKLLKERLTLLNFKVKKILK